ncbi:hypothetical protein BDU57DRAFT_507084 [Ampelomyces quisqualis]|uniref:DUF3176 domain containing protein n=1 Tax=Ampelomyces quisqualis TaxID=50730 RepID=A0A6A5Q906_AMPQU|nr:hypothetical protein BDU57DRAFT_507084 [Ampelomyces quisqualis]
MSASTPFSPGDGILSAPYQDEPRRSSKEPPVRTKTSLNITSRIERKLAQYNASTNLIKRWLFEILSVATSAICMGTIIAILASLKDQPLARWPLGLTIITILSKIASAALILPISEAIGQLKWSWFHGKKSKDAFDFEIFDKASRGAWGSVLLLLRTKGKSLAALGALLTVLLLAIDTFFQQITDLPERWALRGQGLIPRVTRYEPDFAKTYRDDFVMSPIAQNNQELKGVLTPYFYDRNGTQYANNDNESQVGLSLYCPTSKCEWKSYQSQGVCSACVDISHLLTYACLPMKLDWILRSTGPTTEARYPNGTACGYFLNVTSTKPVMMSGYRVADEGNRSAHGETLLMRTLPLVTNPSRDSLYDGTINFRNISHSLLNALIVSSADGSIDSVYRKELPVAHECMLSWCVKTLRSSYSAGIYEENVEEVFLNTTKIPYPWSTTYYPEFRITNTDYRGNISLHPPSSSPSDPAYGLSNNTVMDFTLLFDETFPSLITVANATADPLLKIRTSFDDRIIFRTVHFNPWLAPNNVTHHMERIATALTNVVRSDANSNEFIAGQALALETYIRVNWGWLSFSLAMLGLCILFLFATMVKTSRDGKDDLGIWKTSAMPTLIYGLPQEARHNLTTASTLRNGASGGAEKVRIRLLPNQGWRVSGHFSKSPTTLRGGGSPAPPGWV